MGGEQIFPQEDPEFKELGVNTVLVVSHGGESNPKVTDWAKGFSNADHVEFIRGDNMPDTPPPGVTKAFIFSGLEPKFYDKRHQENWKNVAFQRIVQSRDGATITISRETGKTANDYEVSV